MQVEQAENKPLRNEKGQLLPGYTANPNGRPKGQSLKEYWRERFKKMTDEEKAAFSQKVGLDTIWRMAEGNPAQTNEDTVKAEMTIKVVQYGNNDTP